MPDRTSADTPRSPSGLTPPSVAERTTLLTAKKFAVQRWNVEIGGGTRAYDMVVHPGAAVILPLLDTQNVVMIRQARPAVSDVLLELPAGTLDPDEDPRNCAARELTEETGYTAQRIEPLCWFYATPGMSTERMEVFVAHQLTPGPTQLEPDEHLEVVTVPLIDAVRFAMDGTIRDAKSQLSLLYYAQRHGLST